MVFGLLRIPYAESLCFYGKVVYSMKEHEVFPPRVFALVPLNSENALVIRRGPTSKTGVFRWNVKTNKVTLSQWLKGRIYEHLSDISSNGKYVIYSANKKGDGYTVIAYAPWLKAISFWRNVGGRGGGLFVNNKEYMLYDGSDTYCKFISKEVKSIPRSSQSFIHGVYHSRLMKSGWLLDGQNGRVLTYIKPLRVNLNLVKVFHLNDCCSFKDRGIFWERHKIVSEAQSIELDAWEWCEIVNGYLCWSEKGCLFQVLIDEGMNIAAPTLIYDFKDEKYVGTCAPY